MRIAPTLVLAMIAAPLAASEDCAEDAMIVFDGSGSMGEMGFNLLNQPRIFEAREAMARAIPPIASVRRLGLVLYGPAPRACEGVDLRFGPTEGAGSKILAEIEALKPSGETPLTEAVATAARALSYRDRPGTIVLVTDGKETCGGATCQLARHLAAESAGLTVHVVGFRVQGEHFRYGEGYGQATSVAACLAEETGGRYVPAETVDELVSAMAVTLGCPVYGALAD